MVSEQLCERGLFFVKHMFFSAYLQPLLFIVILMQYFTGGKYVPNWMLSLIFHVMMHFFQGLIKGRERKCHNISFSDT